MEASALVYVSLVVVTLGFALFIDNRRYVGAARPSVYERQQARNLVGEIGIYCLLAGVSACRIAVGNDYWVYRFNFQLIAQGRQVSSEFGFNLLVRWLQDLFGYDRYLPIFGLFSLLTVFFFVKALHDQGKWYAASLYLLLTGGYYFSSLNTVRYYFVLAVAASGMEYVLRREYGKFILLILAAGLFHKSVLLVLPAYPAAAWLSRRRVKKWQLAAAGLLGASLVFGQSWYRRLLFFFYPFYENSAFDDGRISWANVAKCLGVLALSAVCYREGIRDRERNRFYFFLNLGALVVCLCGSFLPEASRVAYYLMIAQIFLIPELLLGMKKGLWRKLCVGGTALAFLLYFVIFLYKAYDVSSRLLPYRNWIFQ
jgi:hypothetical protein